MPDYVSGHAAAGGAAATVIAAVLTDDGRFSLSSTTLTDHLRTFDSVLSAARENAESRVLIGYDFRRATEVGMQLGVDVGRFVIQRVLQPLY